MRIRELINSLDIRLIGDADPLIARVTDDSRDVLPPSDAGGTLFVARAGTKTDGARFVNDAIERGAVAVLANSPAPDVIDGVASLSAEHPDRALAHLAERVCGNPSSDLLVVGVTGTNGKSTVAHIVHRLLNSIGVRCGIVGTIEIDDGDGPRDAHLTTPPAHELSRSLARMVENGCDAVVLEASSHALDQRRVEAIAFDIAVFTNLSGDHLDYHADMDDYASAKARLFELLPSDGLAIVNADDPAHTRMLRDCEAHVDRVASMRDPRVREINVTLSGTSFQFDKEMLSTRLIGAHNAMNAAQALIVCRSVCERMHVDASSLGDALDRIEVPRGRLDRVDAPRESPAVFVDYAHTDDALTHACAALKPLVPMGGKLIVIFGCGGDRDRTKRPRMARAVAAHANRIVITSDNPRTEDPESIIDEVASGVPAGVPFSRDADRRSAISNAIASAGADDVILIAGKGHETYQLLPDPHQPGGITRIDFDDRLVAHEAIEARRTSTEARA